MSKITDQQRAELVVREGAREANLKNIMDHCSRLEEACCGDVDGWRPWDRGTEEDLKEMRAQRDALYFELQRLKKHFSRVLHVIMPDPVLGGEEEK